MRALLFTLPLVFAAAPMQSCGCPSAAEDDPCWDCSTQGNDSCEPQLGTPTTTPPVTVVIG